MVLAFRTEEVKVLLDKPTPLSTIVVNPISDAISMSYKIPVPETEAQVNVVGTATPVAPSVGEVSVVAPGLGSEISNVTSCVFVAEGAVPVTVMVYDPAIAPVIPETVMITGVPSVTAVAGEKPTSDPAGSPEAENTVVSLNPRKVL